MDLQLVRADPDDQDQVALVVACSHDVELVHNTYLPGSLTPDGAAAWLDSLRHAWFVAVDGQLAGMVLLHDEPDSGDVPVPPGSVEAESWLLPAYRGQGLVTAAFDQLVPTLPDCYRHLVEVIWADNLPSLRRAEKAGYLLLGETVWSDEHGSGPCQVWCLPVAA